MILVKCDQNIEEKDVSPDSDEVLTFENPSNEGSDDLERRDLENEIIDNSCKDFTKKESNRMKHKQFRLQPKVVNPTTLTISWNPPNIVKNETVCGYVLTWSIVNNKTDHKTVQEKTNEPFLISNLNSSLEYQFYVDLYYQGGLQILESTILKMPTGWSNEIPLVGNYLVATNHTTPKTIPINFSRDSMHPISPFAIFIIAITMITLIGVLSLAIFRCVANRAGTPYIFNQPVLNTQESLTRARNKVRQMKNIFKNGPRSDRINFSSLVDQSELEGENVA